MVEITESMVAGNVKADPRNLLKAIGLADGRGTIANLERQHREDIETDVPE